MSAKKQIDPIFTRLIQLFTLCLLLGACSHPLEIVGQGDIRSLSSERDCSLEESPCTNNVVNSYHETYYPSAHAEWEFSHWENYCENSTIRSCRFDVSIATVHRYWFKSMAPLVAHFVPMESSQMGQVTSAAISAATIQLRSTEPGSVPLCEFKMPAHDSLETAGQFPIPDSCLDSLPEDKAFVIVVRGGVNLDLDRDGEIDATPTPLVGQFHSLLTYTDISNERLIVSSLTEALYQSIQFSITGLDANQLRPLANHLSQSFIQYDLNGDNQIDWTDLQRWDPVTHWSALKSPGALQRMESRIYGVNQHSSQAAQNFNPERTFETNTPIVDYQFDGEWLYVASMRSFHRFRPDGSSSDLLDISDTVIDMALDADRAYLLLQPGTLQIVDLSEGAELAIIAELDLPRVVNIDVEGQALVALREVEYSNSYDLIHLDISDLENPVEHSVDRIYANSIALVDSNIHVLTEGSLYTYEYDSEYDFGGAPWITETGKWFESPLQISGQLNSQESLRKFFAHSSSNFILGTQGLLQYHIGHLPGAIRYQSRPASFVQRTAFTSNTHDASLSSSLFLLLSNNSVSSFSAPNLIPENVAYNVPENYYQTIRSSKHWLALGTERSIDLAALPAKEAAQDYQGLASYGRIAGAMVAVQHPDSDEVLCSTISLDHPDIRYAGLIQIPEECVNADEIYLITVDRGVNLDLDQDGQRDAVPTPVLGSLHAIMSGDDMSRAWSVNAATEFAYQRSLVESDTTTAQLLDRQGANATTLFYGDPNRYNQIDRHDLYNFGVGHIGEADTLAEAYTAIINAIEQSVLLGADTQAALSPFNSEFPQIFIEEGSWVGVSKDPESDRVAAFSSTKATFLNTDETDFIDFHGGVSLSASELPSSIVWNNDNLYFDTGELTVLDISDLSEPATLYRSDESIDDFWIFPESDLLIGVDYTDYSYIFYGEFTTRLRLFDISNINEPVHTNYFDWIDSATVNQIFRRDDYYYVQGREKGGYPGQAYVGSRLTATYIDDAYTTGLETDPVTLDFGFLTTGRYRDLLVLDIYPDHAQGVQGADSSSSSISGGSSGGEGYDFLYFNFDSPSHLILDAELSYNTAEYPEPEPVPGEPFISKGVYKGQERNMLRVVSEENPDVILSAALPNIPQHRISTMIVGGDFAYVTYGNTLYRLKLQ